MQKKWEYDFRILSKNWINFHFTFHLVWHLGTPNLIQPAHPVSKQGHLLLDAGESKSQQDRHASCLGKLNQTVFDATNPGHHWEHKTSNPVQGGGVNFQETALYTDTCQWELYREVNLRKRNSFPDGKTDTQKRHTKVTPSEQKDNLGLNSWAHNEQILLLLHGLFSEDPKCRLVVLVVHLALGWWNEVLVTSS